MAKKKSAEKQPPQKATARGRRKSIIDEYKAKARGKKTSSVSEGDAKKAKKKTPQPAIKKYQPILTMTIDGETYSEGDVAWYVLEGQQHSKRPRSGEIKECHPTDSTAPCVTVIDHTFKHYRAIRAELIGWSKAEAKKKWENFVNTSKDYRG